MNKMNHGVSFVGPHAYMQMSKTQNSRDGEITT